MTLFSIISVSLEGRHNKVESRTKVEQTPWVSAYARTRVGVLRAYTLTSQQATEKQSNMVVS